MSAGFGLRGTFYKSGRSVFEWLSVQWYLTFTHSLRLSLYCPVGLLRMQWQQLWAGGLEEILELGKLGLLIVYPDIAILRKFYPYFANVFRWNV
jgi:hypothetical protein